MQLDRKTIEKDEEYLRGISTPIDFEKDNYKDYIQKLKEYCTNHSCYALAPVQIGIPKRIIYIKNSSQDMMNNDIKDYNEEIIYINPEIISVKGTTRFLEGCESCIYTKNQKIIYYAGIVDRPYQIKIKYYDQTGTKQIKTIEGFESTVFSHEYDHLNGILHMDKSSKIFEMTADQIREYRKNHPYEVLSMDNKI